MVKLKELRVSRGLSQKELAELFGVSNSTISMYEMGQREPDFATIVKFADFFGVSTDYLLGRDKKSSGVEEIVPRNDEERTFIRLLRESDEVHRRLAAGILQASAVNTRPVS